MLTSFFGGFANFTVVNSRFLSPGLKCKHPPLVQNSRFTFRPARLQTGIAGHSRTRITRWQNTISVFLNAQLDFLAIFSIPPYLNAKNAILRQSGKEKICNNLTNHPY